MLIGMDSANLRNMCRMCGGDEENKIHAMMDYTDRPGEVADRGIPEILRIRGAMSMRAAVVCWNN